MKTPLSYSFITLALLATLNCPFPVLHAQGTAFTYQGRLNDGAGPATGLYDLKFALYDLGSGGTQQGGVQTKPFTDVTNGLFAVKLDFGNQFPGADRWLEIQVRTNGGSVFTVLAPRQLLTSTPYAIYANTASNVVSGVVVKSLNNLKEDVTLAAGANVTVTPSGNTLTIAAATGGGSSIWSQLNNNAYYNTGNVGIGTTTPLGKLDVVGQDALRLIGFNPFITLYDSNAGSARSRIQGVGGDVDLFTESYLSGANPYAFLKLANNGNVGIGSANPVGKLEVVAQDALRLIGSNPFLTLYDTSAGYARSRIQGVGGDVDLFTESYLSGANPYSFLKLANNGNVGIGSANPVGKLEVVAQDALRLIGYQPFLTLYDSSAGYAGSRIQGVGGDIILEPNSSVNGSDPNAYAKLFNSGNFSVKTLTIRGGADLAEPFEFSANDIAKGSVLVIDDEQPGKLKLSTRAYDTRVAGIVSGANGVNPGISLHQDGILDSGQNVALSGRVYVLADATQGAIRPGDLLTTSDTPGHAMKVLNHTQSQGAILGKAMSTLKEGQGMVLVLVTLQ